MISTPVPHQANLLQCKTPGLFITSPCVVLPTPVVMTMWLLSVSKVFTLAFSFNSCVKHCANVCSLCVNSLHLHMPWIYSISYKPSNLIPWPSSPTACPLLTPACSLLLLFAINSHFNHLPVFESAFGLNSETNCHSFLS